MLKILFYLLTLQPLVVIIIALSMSWSLRKIDINNAFSNGELTRDIYIEQSIGFKKRFEYSLQIKQSFVWIRRSF